MIKKITTVVIALSLGGCFSMDNNKEEEKVKTSILGERDIKYYSNKTVTSLEVPPDLTKPSSQSAFRLSEYVNDIHEDVVSFSAGSMTDSGKKSENNSNIQVVRSGDRRWLKVNKEPNEVWNLSKSFLKQSGFIIKKSNKKTGVMETDFLENHPEIPEASLGIIRSALRGALQTTYTLPIVDKYRIRIEPINNGTGSEVYLTLTSMEEVLTSAGAKEENTIWQSRPKDQDLEVEMLYRLMTFLGSDRADARAKILEAKSQQKVIIKSLKGIGGYAKLAFSLNQSDTWDSMNWALDQLNVNVEDKDIKEGSFYINIARTQDKSILTRLFGEEHVQKSFQIMVKQIDSNKTEVYFNDLSEENEQETIDFSYEFLGDIAKQF